MVAISSSPSRSSNNSPAAASSNARFSSLSSSSSSSPVSLSSYHGNQYSSNSSRNSSSQSSCRFLTFLSFLVLSQFLLLPITVHYYLSSSVLLQQQAPPQQNDILGSSSTQSSTRTIQSSNQRDSFQQQPPKKSNYDVNAYRDGTFNGAPLRLKTVTIAAAATKQEQEQEQSPQQSQQTLPSTTRIHCVGENYNAAGGGTAWQQRSCEFQHLFCFNTSSQRFVVFQSQSERLLSDFLTQRVYDMHASSTLIRYKNSHHQSNNSIVNGMGTVPTTIRSEQTMSIGGINKKWGDAGIQRLEWFPDIISSQAETQASSTIASNTTTTWQYFELPPSYIMIPYHSLNGANPGECIRNVHVVLFCVELYLCEWRERERV
jgi:hypothetical protein